MDVNPPEEDKPQWHISSDASNSQLDIPSDESISRLEESALTGKSIDAPEWVIQKQDTLSDIGSSDDSELVESPSNNAAQGRIISISIAEKSETSSEGTVAGLDVEWLDEISGDVINLQRMVDDTDRIHRPKPRKQASRSKRSRRKRRKSIS